MNTVNDIYIGADPELFVMDVTTKRFVSAHNLLPGTKQTPFEVNCGAVQVDGTAAEFNIWPCNEREKFVSNIREVTKSMADIIKSFNPSAPMNFDLVAVPTAFYPKKYFSSLPDSAKELGCDPDYNAWTGEVNEKPDGRVTYRTGGGHVHVGFTEGKDIGDKTHLFDCMSVVKQLDTVLYIQSRVFDRDTRRRELYGKPGAFRPKAYGTEYRTLSNFWVGDPDLVGWVFDATQSAVKLLFEGKRIYEDEWMLEYLNKDRPSPEEILEAYFYSSGWSGVEIPEHYINSFAAAHGVKVNE